MPETTCIDIELEASSKSLYERVKDLATTYEKIYFDEPRSYLPRRPPPAYKPGPAQPKPKHRPFQPPATEKAKRRRGKKARRRENRRINAIIERDKRHLVEKYLASMGPMTKTVNPSTSRFNIPKSQPAKKVTPSNSATISKPNYNRPAISSHKNSLPSMPEVTSKPVNSTSTITDSVHRENTTSSSKPSSGNLESESTLLDRIRTLEKSIKDKTKSALLLARKSGNKAEQNTMIRLMNNATDQCEKLLQDRETLYKVRGQTPVIDSRSPRDVKLAITFFHEVTE